MPQTLLDAPCWHQSVAVHKEYEGIYDYFCTNAGQPLDRCGGPLMVSLGITAASQLEAFKDDRVPPYRDAAAHTDFPPAGGAAGPEEGGAAAPYFPYMMAVPFTVSDDACEADVFLRRDGAEGPGGGGAYMCESALTMLTDMVTSFHLMCCLFPAKPGHVSVSLQAQQHAAAAAESGGRLRRGHRYVAVSTVDKLGRRIAFCTVRYYALPLGAAEGEAGAGGPSEAHAAAARAETAAELEAALRALPTVALHRHIKSILSDRATSAASVGRPAVAGSPNSP